MLRESAETRAGTNAIPARQTRRADIAIAIEQRRFITCYSPYVFVEQFRVFSNP
jgi:galactose-1-phosphate uridylyltransferase